MEYTKGEWKYTRPQIGTSGGVICTMIEPHYMPDCGDNTWYNGCVKTMETNAHLIAAAPDMYEALKALTKHYIANQGISGEFIVCITPEGIPEYWENAKQALAKAEGKGE